jgi:hypothetical protein
MVDDGGGAVQKSIIVMHFVLPENIENTKKL